MMDIRHAIREVGLQYVESHDLHDGTVVHEADYTMRHEIASKYLFFQTDMTLIETISNDESFSAFIKEHIENLYFSLMDGDFRWNLYWIFVLSNEDYRNLTSETRGIIEGNRKYARKLIVSEGSFQVNIPVARLLKDASISLMEDPLEDWTRILQPVGLEFCLEGKDATSISRYLDGNLSPIERSSISRKPDTRQSLDKISSRLKISSLEFGTGYRSHCFSDGTRYEFSLVNIIQGANGSGKTSILESIELALTGNTQRNKLAKSDSDSTDEIWDGALLCDNAESFTSLPLPKERKLRESKWYQNKEKRIDKLNAAFHQYNYFSSEDAYKFAFDKEGQPDYGAEFSRIIYGQDLAIIERNWKHHNSLFADQKRQIEKEIERINRVTSEIDSAVQGSTGIDITLNTLKDLLRLLGMDRWSQGLSHTEPRELPALLRELGSELVEIQSLTDHLVQLQKSVGNPNFSNLKHSMNEKKEQCQAVENQLLGITENLLLLSQQETESGRDLSRLREERETLKSSIFDLKELVRITQQHKLVFGQYPRAVKRIELDDRIQATTKQIDLLNYVHHEFAELLDETAIGESLEDLMAMQARLGAQMETIQADLNQLGLQIRDEESKIEADENLVVQIKVLGRRYIETFPNSTVCPLCGTDHQNIKGLIDAFVSGVDSSRENLDELYSRREEVERSQEELLRQYEDVRKRVNVVRRFQSAAEFLVRNSLVQGPKVESSLTDRECLAYLREVLLLQDKTSHDLEKLHRDAKELDISGITSQSVAEAMRLLREFPQLESWREQFESGEGAFLRFTSWSDEQITKQQMAVLAIEQQLEKVEQGKIACEHQIMDLTKQSENLKEQLLDIQSNIAQLEDWFRVMDLLVVKGVKIEDYERFVAVTAYIKRLAVELEQLQLKVQKLRVFEERQLQMQQLREELSLNEKRLQNCCIAIDTIGHLKDLSLYIQKFLSSNIVQISDLFLALHSPKEFEYLTLDDNKSIVAIRQPAGNSPTVPVHQMSTGQRAAVALAVFFTLHLSMPTAPSFIMLDEPVANMDDLNVLGLIDFLRELTSSRGTQIFLTTANPVVAGLFRRKFSFLREEYRDFRLVRFGNGTVNCRMTSFAPTSNKPILDQVL